MVIVIIFKDGEFFVVAVVRPLHPSSGYIHAQCIAHANSSAVARACATLLMVDPMTSNDYLISKIVASPRPSRHSWLLIIFKCQMAKWQKQQKRVIGLLLFPILKKK